MYKNASKPEYVLCAAIWVDDKQHHLHQPHNIETGYVVAGWRHHNCIQLISMICSGAARGAIQGFLTSKGRFIDRSTAGRMAKEVGQIDYKCSLLFSEDLY